jgi:predicted MPP superfamily phosphohydrolase
LATLAVGGAGLSAGAYARYAEPAWLEVSETSIDRAIFPAPRGLRILHLSDLHFGPHVPLELIERAVELGLAQRPDLIALTGDFVTGRLREAAAYAAVLRRLSVVAPTFALVIMTLSSRLALLVKLPAPLRSWDCCGWGRSTYW